MLCYRFTLVKPFNWGKTKSINAHAYLTISQILEEKLTKMGMMFIRNCKKLDHV